MLRNCKDAGRVLIQVTLKDPLLGQSTISCESRMCSDDLDFVIRNLSPSPPSPATPGPSLQHPLPPGFLQEPPTCLCSLPSSPERSQGPLSNINEVTRSVPNLSKTPTVLQGESHPLASAPTHRPLPRAPAQPAASAFPTALTCQPSSFPPQACRSCDPLPECSGQRSLQANLSSPGAQLRCHLSR